MPDSSPLSILGLAVALALFVGVIRCVDRRACARDARDRRAAARWNRLAAVLVGLQLLLILLPLLA